MSKLITPLIGLALITVSFVTGYYARSCPTCPACVQVEQTTVRQEQAAPALAVVTKAADREAELQKQIGTLKTEAAQRPKERVVTIVKEVPVECQPHVERQAKADASACLEPQDLNIINRARRATME